MNAEELLDLGMYSLKAWQSLANQNHFVGLDEPMDDKPCLNIDDFLIYQREEDNATFGRFGRTLMPVTKWYVQVPSYDPGYWDARAGVGLPPSIDYEETGPFSSVYEAIKEVFSLIVKDRLDGIFETWGEVDV